MSSTIFPAGPAPTLSEILDAGFRLFRLTLPPNLVLSLPMIAAAQAANMYGLLHAGRDGLWWFLALVGAVLSLLFWSALVLRQSASGGPDTPGVGAALAQSVSLLPGLVVLAIASVVAIGAGLLLLVVPGLLAMLVALLAPVALVLERAQPWAALQSAWRMLRPRLGVSMAVMVLTLAVFLVFYIVFAVSGVMVGQALTGVADDRRFSAYAGYVALALFAPLLSAMSLALHAALTKR